ncbi:MAG TPA: L,D-transpeptidase family protein [Polyangia bacterium]|jgi:murein L,D-transpeptidase YafK
MGALPWIVALLSMTSPVAVDPCAGTTDARIVVDTAKHRLALCESTHQVASFGVRLGHGGVGKTTEGDGKTPLGLYTLGVPRPSAHFGIFIPIGYPTDEQRQRGFTGGAVGVHGPHRWVRWLGSLVNTFDSSDGCVGVATDRDIDTIATWAKQAKARKIELR